jgi:hypothetical protein
MGHVARAQDSADPRKVSSMPFRACLRRLAILAVVAIMAGCAGPVAEWPSASSGPIATNDTAWLEGVWSGTEWESSAAYFQGVHDLAVTFSADGMWAAIDKSGRRSAGSVRVDNGRVILDRWTGASTPLHCSLAVSPDSRHLFAIIVTSFGGRRAPAALSLERVQDRP